MAESYQDKECYRGHILRLGIYKKNKCAINLRESIIPFADSRNLTKRFASHLSINKGILRIQAIRLMKDFIITCMSDFL